MSGIAYRRIATRSIPRPNANPVYRSLSYPQFSSTFGCTIPAPSSSIHPLPHVGQPAPSQRKQVTPTCGARFDEREVRRREPDPPLLAEQALGHRLEGSLEVGERDPLVDRERLHLVEHGQVGRVRRLASIDAAGSDDVHRRRLRLHRADLHRRRLGAKQELRMPGDRHVEGILHRPRRVVLGDVERLEVVPVILDLRAFRDADSPGGGTDPRSRPRRASTGAGIRRAGGAREG